MPNFAQYHTHTVSTMPFQLHDHVLVKPDTCIEETGEIIPGWQGEVMEIFEAENGEIPHVLIQLDAISLQNVPEKFTAICLEDWGTPFEYILEEDTLELAQRRDTKEERKSAQDDWERAHSQPVEDLHPFQEYVSNWYEQFKNSAQFAELSEEEQRWSLSIVETLTEVAYTQCLEIPEEWSPITLNDICLDYFPGFHVRKDEFFTHVPAVLSAFFGYLSEKELLENAADLQKHIQKIGPKLVKDAHNPNKWFRKKAFFMNAVHQGADEEEPETMEKILVEYNDFLIQEITQRHTPETPPYRAAAGNPFKNLSRNQVITVQYLDGTTRVGKFKRLETDLQAGNCLLV